MTWEFIIRQLINKYIGQSHVSSKDYVYDKIEFLDFEPEEDPFKICCYSNTSGKIDTLMKQYYNKEEWEKVKKGEKVNVSMIGGPKWGSTKGNKHCITSLEIDPTKQEVMVYFRNSDFFKKFLVDIKFIKFLLEEENLDNYRISCRFEKLTLRLPFAYIYLNYLYNKHHDKNEIINLVNNNDLFKDFITYYQNIKDKPLTYKSLERCRRYMYKTSVYQEILKEFNI